ncbi:hypothetical protein BAE44_0021741 [Dichanthelium oligosanthes]|uniref:Protein DCL, chloroplastic n=1 Tax=Dichanthelium oligosanthes TaxID=888268 RepID=A0A1E5UWH7_9POAL|nr:hypothetical protein BAE44_0021741 [Dichanthelium oligosanthes]
MVAALSLHRAAAPLILLRAARFAPWAASAPRRRLLSGPLTAGEPPPPALPPTSKLADPPVVGSPEPALPFRAAEAEILRDIEPVVQLIKDILHSDSTSFSPSNEAACVRPSRYGDGECLCPKDENVVVGKLLAFHPRAQDKIGCGLDAIMVSEPKLTPAQFYSLAIIDSNSKFIFMIQKCRCNRFSEPGLSLKVDRHPEFRKSRCLFVVRTDGVWIDFSYQKCLRAYIREKYPSHAERFIREHFKRT